MNFSKVDQLVETTINGNSIANNKTYMNMIKSITYNDIIVYADTYGYTISANDLGKSKKIDAIKSIVKRNF